MEVQQQNGAGATRAERVKSSIQKLKEKFVPGVKYSLLVTLVIYFVMLIIGSLNAHKCPVNEQIPLFLIATGALGLFASFISYLRDRILPHMETKYLESALYSAQSIFFILGMYWVYKEFKPSFDPADGDRYCNKTAYMFAFIYLTVFVAIALTILFGFCCFLCCACFVASTADSVNVAINVESPRGRNHDDDDDDDDHDHATINLTHKQGL